MIVEIPSYKYIDKSQQIDLSINKICTLIGGNGSGKSTILESIFANYNEKIISFKFIDKLSFLKITSCSYYLQQIEKICFLHLLIYHMQVLYN